MSSARFCPACGTPVAVREPVTASANGRPATLPREELDAALAARQELGARMEPEVVDAFLARVENAIDARVDARVSRGVREPFPRRSASARSRNFTGRIAASLALGIPLSAIALGVASRDGVVSAVAVVAVWAAIVILNIYYTEVEKEIALKRGD